MTSPVYQDLALGDRLPVYMNMFLGSELVTGPFRRRYREEGLALRAKRLRRRKMVVHREQGLSPQHSNEAPRQPAGDIAALQGQRAREISLVRQQQGKLFARFMVAIHVTGKTCRNCQEALFAGAGAAPSHGTARAGHTDPGAWTIQAEAVWVRYRPRSRS